MLNARLAFVCVLVPAVAQADAPKELTDLAKATAGTWKCTGTASNGGAAKIDLKTTLTSKLDGMWIETSWTVGSTKWTSYTTYNAGDLAFYRHTVSSAGDSENAAATSGGIAAAPGMSFSGEWHPARAAKVPAKPKTEQEETRQQAIEQARAAGILAPPQAIKVEQLELVGKNGYAIEIGTVNDGGKGAVKVLELVCKK
jgi:hypothetical protein